MSPVQTPKLIAVIGLVIGLGSLGAKPLSGAIAVDPDATGVEAAANNPAGTIRFLYAALTGAELYSISFPLTREAGSTGTVSVRVSTTAEGSTATADVDYVAKSEIITWGNGDSTNKNFSVDIITDAAMDQYEIIRVKITDPTGGVTLGTPSFSQVTLSDQPNFPGKPIISTISPNSGDVNGGTDVAITGWSLNAQTKVLFGGQPCKNVQTMGSSKLTCTTPPHAAGKVDVVIESSFGPTSPLGIMNDFTYEVVPATPTPVATSTASPSGLPNGPAATPSPTPTPTPTGWLRTFRLRGMAVASDGSY